MLIRRDQQAVALERRRHKHATSQLRDGLSERAQLIHRRGSTLLKHSAGRSRLAGRLLEHRRRTVTGEFLLKPTPSLIGFFELRALRRDNRRSIADAHGQSRSNRGERGVIGGRTIHRTEAAYELNPSCLADSLRAAKQDGADFSGRPDVRSTARASV